MIHLRSTTTTPFVTRPPSFAHVARHNARIYARLQLLHVRSHLEYEADFWIAMVGAACTQFANFVFIWALFSRIPSVEGWTLWEIAFLYGLTTFPRGAASLLCSGPFQLRSLVNSGQFDRLLVRPISPALQVVTQTSNLQGSAVMLISAVLLARASSQLHVPWDVSKAGMLLLTLLSSSVLFGAMNLVTNCIAFWEPQANSAFPFAVASIMEMARYPLTLYGWFVQVVLTWVVPIAFVSYFPGSVLLDKAPIPAWLGLAAPLATAGVVLVTAVVWHIGVDRYQSTGH